MSIRSVFTILLASTVSIVFWTCKRNPVDPVQTQVQLTASNVGAAELLLTVVFPGGGDFEIDRDGVRILHGRLTGIDTTVIDDSLTAGAMYTYQAKKLEGGKVVGTSGEVRVKMMDATNGNISWQTFVLGDLGYASSILRDVAVVNDSLVYAVGAIYLNDSSGTIDPHPYNVAMWNGSRWSAQRLTYLPPTYSGDSLIGQGSAIFARSSRDIWTICDVVYHFDGNGWMPLYNTGAEGAKRIFCDTVGNLWAVGRGGLIVHNKGTVWSNSPSPTNQDLQDVYGSPDGSVVFASGYSIQTGESVVLKYDGTSWKIIYQITPSDPLWGARVADTLCGGVITFWTDTGVSVWSATTTGIYKSFYLKSGRIDRISWAPSYVIGFTWTLRGGGDNDLFVVGDFATIAHWNGSAWTDFSSEFSSLGGSLRGVSVIPHLVASVGYTTNTGGLQSKAVVIFGRK